MKDDIYDIIWNKYHNNLCYDMKRYLSQKYVYIKIYVDIFIIAIFYMHIKRDIKFCFLDK